MSAIDQILQRVSEHNVSDKEIMQLMGIVNNFAKKYEGSPDTEIMAKVEQAKMALVAKMGNKEIEYHQEAPKNEGVKNEVSAGEKEKDKKQADKKPSDKALSADEAKKAPLNSGLADKIRKLRGR